MIPTSGYTISNLHGKGILFLDSKTHLHTAPPLNHISITSVPIKAEFGNMATSFEMKFEYNPNWFTKYQLVKWENSIIRSVKRLPCILQYRSICEWAFAGTYSDCLSTILFCNITILYEKFLKCIILVTNNNQKIIGWHLIDHKAEFYGRKHNT